MNEKKKASAEVEEQEKQAVVDSQLEEAQKAERESTLECVAEMAVMGKRMDEYKDIANAATNRADALEQVMRDFVVRCTCRPGGSRVSDS